MSKLNMKNFDEMIGKEFTVLQFSNDLVELGCEDIYNMSSEDLKYLIKEVDSIAVKTNVYDETFEKYIEIDFSLEVIKDAEDIDDVIIKVTDTFEL